ncbi:MAG TPA: CpaD family pilus assembly protein [Methyloceanibacter sp.]|jgi:pilus assembly protein CpaD
MLAPKFTLRSRTLTILASLLVSTSLTGCFNAGPRFQAPLTLGNPNERHPIQVAQTEATLDLVVTSGNGLSSAQTAQLRAYLRAYKKEGERLMVNAPSGGSNDAASMRAFEDVRKALRQAGISADSVLLETYYVNGQQSAALRLSFLHYEAKAPDCPDWSENVGRDPQNTSWPNMGCATQRNLAVAVADPRDLMGPRDETPRPGERRDDVWNKYIEGKKTISERASSEHANASEISQIGTSQ